MEGDITTNAVEGVEVASVSEATVPQKKHRKPINQQKLQDNIWGWTFCIPLIVGTVLFIYIAFVLAILVSFTSWKLGGSKTIWDVIGNYGDNITSAKYGGAFAWYKDLFTHKVSVGASDMKYNEMGLYLFNTVFYMIGIPIGMVLAVFFAVCMSRDIKGGNVFRVVYYLPCVASAVAIIFTFKIVFSSNGVINQLFGLGVSETRAEGFTWIPVAPNIGNSWNMLLGLDQATHTSWFMRDQMWCQGLFSKLVIVIMSVWKGLGGTIILYLAGLSGVNASTKEAAQIDGANGWKIFWKVTMPDLYPVIFYNIVTSVIGGLQIYAEPEILMGTTSPMTSGFASLVYNYGIGQGYAGKGSAYGIFLAAIIFVLTLFQFWLDKKNSD